MATYHCSVRAGGKGKAAAHAAYISRVGKYAQLRAGERLEHVEHGNMPNWAAHDPAQFWHCADRHERANGSTYREFELALPRELTPDQRRELVRDFVAQEIGDWHAYTFAIHNPRAALDKGEQPHAHIMFSQRRADGIERDPEQYFKRYNAKSPERGGCQKLSGGKTRAERKAELVALRARWAEKTNAHLKQHGHDAAVDHRSLKARGLEREPESHFGPKKIRRMNAEEVGALLKRRAAEGELERAQREVSSIDLSGSLAAARRERDRRQAAQTAAAGVKDARARFDAFKAAQQPAATANQVQQAKDELQQWNARKQPAQSPKQGLILTPPNEQEP